MKKKTEKTYEKDYFCGRYKNITGNFSEKELTYSRNWFSAWLKKLSYYLPVYEGKGKRVLEIGCSIGGVSTLLKERGYEVYATDISEYATRKAKKLSPQINFFQHDISNPIPLKEKFDLVIAFEVVEHLNTPLKAMGNIYNILKPNGVLVFSSPYPYSWSWSDQTHVNVLYPHEWMNMMRQMGFKEVSYHKFSLLPYLYKIHPSLQLIIPFHIPLSFINNPILYIGRKGE